MLETLVDKVRDVFGTNEPDPPAIGLVPVKPLSEGSDEILTGPQVLADIDAQWDRCRAHLAKDLRFHLSASFPQPSVQIHVVVTTEDPHEELIVTSPPA